MDRADYTYYVDWNNDGNFGHAYADISAYVLSAQWEFGSQSAPPEPASPGRLTIILDNSTSIFSPNNLLSPIAGLIVRDLRVLVKMEISGGGEVAQYGARLETIIPVTGPTIGTSTAIMTATGVLSLFQKGTVEVALQEDIDTGAAMSALLTADSFPVGDQDIATGQSTLSKWWLRKNTSKLTAMHELELAELGNLCEAKDGKLAFRSRAHAFTAPHDDPQATYGTGTLRMWNVRQLDPLAGIYDMVRAQVRTFNHSEDVTLAVITDIASGLGSKPLVVPASGSLTVVIELNEKTSPSNYIGVYDWTTVDYECNTAADLSGTDITTDVSAVKTEYGPKLEIVFTNPIASDAYLVVLRAHGIAIVEGDPIPVVSGTGKNEFPYINPWATDYGDEQARCDYLLSIYSVRRTRLMFDVMANYDAAHLAETQARDVGDRIRVVASLADFGLAIDEEFIIDHIARHVDAARVDVMTITCTLAPASSLAASGTAYTAKTIPSPGGTKVPDDLMVMGVANGLEIIAGCIAWKWNAGIVEAEFRAKWFSDVQGSDVDLRTVAEGGTFVGGTAEEILETGLVATQDGVNWTWDSSLSGSPALAGPGVWYYSFRLKNAAGWSVWSDGNDTPQYVPDYIKTGDEAEASDGPPEDWAVTVEPGPGPNTVVVRATRPQVNGNVIFFAAFQIKDTTSGTWLDIDAATAPADVLFDGSAIPCTYDKSAGTLTLDASPAQDFFPGGDPGVGMMILMDVRGGAFDKNHCQWGAITWAQVSGNVITGLPNFRPVLTADLNDIRIMIVRPPWEWSTDGFLGPAGFWMGEYWLGGGDTSSSEFTSKPFILPSGVNIADVGGRVWFANTYSFGDDDENTGGGDGGYSTGLCVVIPDTDPIVTNARLTYTPMEKIFVVSVDGDRVLANPINSVCGQKISWRIINTSDDDIVITLDDKFRSGQAFPVVGSPNIAPFDITEEA